MATAKYPIPQDTPIRQIDAYTTPLKVYAGETFEWTTTAPAGTTVIIQPVAGQNWPLTQSSYSVTAGSPTSAQVNATNSAGQVAQFQCSPSAPTSPQTIAVATNLYAPCNDVSIQQGQCFGWQNNTGKKVHIKGTGNWPKLHEIDNNAIVLLYVDANVAAAPYPLSVSEPNGKGVCADVAGNPKIIVTTPPVPKGNR